MTETDVGRLRQASAFCDSDRPLIIVSTDPKIQQLDLVVGAVYPDTCIFAGKDFHRCFKIEIRRREIDPDVKENENEDQSKKRG